MPMKVSQSIALLAVTGLVCSLASCDKMSELVATAQNLGSENVTEGSGDSAHSVDSVTESEGLAVISEESRMVVVEFYSDT